MKKILQLLLFAFPAAAMLTSCDYREYAPAEYPENYVYQPMADIEGGIWYISSPDVEDAGLPSSGAPVKYFVDKENGKMFINLGIVQSGISLKPCTVNISVAQSVVNALIVDGTFDPRTTGLPEAAYKLPSSVEMTGTSDTAPFTLEINTNIFQAGEYAGKKVAIAIRIMCDEIAVNPELDTMIICIDPSYLNE